MASAPKDVEMGKSPEEEEASSKAKERSDSFYVKLLDSERKKTNGEGEMDEELELTPEEMKQLTTAWVGKKINLRHDLKGGFGKITAAWHTKDGKTHVRLTPGTSEAGKKAADMIKKGEITSVSAGWQVHKDKDSGRVVNKVTDHVALTNLPVYEGTVIYAMASKDAGIKPDTNGVLRTKGGLAVLPVMENSNAAVLVDNMVQTKKDGFFGPPPPRTPMSKHEKVQGKLDWYESQSTAEIPDGFTPETATDFLWSSLFPSQKGKSFFLGKKKSQSLVQC